MYGDSVTGKRGGADVSASALTLARADGSDRKRITACPGRVCDEYGAVWSPQGKSVAFVTTDPGDQTQIAVFDRSSGAVRIITKAHGPVSEPKWSPDGNSIAFLYSKDAPKTPGPLNPLARDAGVLSSVIYEQRLAVAPARGGPVRVLGPAGLNIYEYDWSPDGNRFAISSAYGSGDDNWWVAELETMDAPRAK